MYEVFCNLKVEMKDYLSSYWFYLLFFKFISQSPILVCDSQYSLRIVGSGMINNFLINIETSISHLTESPSFLTMFSSGFSSGFLSAFEAKR